MTTLIAYYWFWLLLGLLVGVATAWWTWGRRPRAGGWDNSGGILGMDQSWPAPVRPAVRPDREMSKDGDMDRAEVAPDNPETPAPVNTDADDLTLIKGIDPQMAGMLKLLGVSRYSQIADWAEADAAQMSVLLGTDSGRIMDGQWIEQARLLAAGNTVEF